MGGVFGQQDIGWAGAFVPLIVSQETLAELRNLAGMPAFPGQRFFQTNLVTGECKWMARPRRSNSRRSSRRRRR